MKKIKFLSILLSLSLVLGGCNMSNTAKGGVIGGGGGAALGAIIGQIAGKGKGAAIGAAVGAVAGTTAGVLIGKKMDKAAQQAKEIEGATVTQGEDNGVPYVKVTLDSGITFPTNGTTLSAASKNSLSTFARTLDPQFDLAIAGHTDNTGTLAVNQRISQERANAVAAYLRSCGIAPNRIQSVIGYDYQDPIADNSTPQGRAQNRRVEIYLLPSQAMINEANAQAH